MSEETGINLSRLREQRGKTQEEVAADLETEQTNVSRHERTGNVSLQWLERYADYYDVSVDAILGRKQAVGETPRTLRETPPVYRNIDQGERMIAILIEILSLGLEEYRRRRKAS